jgi:quinol monooxygenase YgiN
LRIAKIDVDVGRQRKSTMSRQFLAPVQKAKGVTAQAVYRAVDNPNDITITHEFASIEAAQAFAKSVELKSAMQNAGVAGVPTIWFTDKS